MGTAKIPWAWALVRFALKVFALKTKGFALGVVRHAFLKLEGKAP
jgi:hypothetical protein